MRKVILSAAITLDGYIARPNGATDFIPMPKGASKVMAEFFSTIDTVIMGRKTAPVSGGSSSFPVQIPTYVFSRSQPPGERDGLIYVNEPPGDLIARVRERPGKNIFLMGGGELARDFLRADLVDEISLSVVPLLLGDGIPLFPSGFPQLKFTLVESNTIAGLLAFKYKRRRATPPGKQR
jgi:dihydrofolate reductase